MNIRTTRETTAARVGGIWAVPASKDGLLRIALDSNLFAGAVDAAFTNVKQIFNGTTVTSAANNYTATAGFADATGADGQTTSALSAAGTALTFYDQTLGLDITDDVNENWGKTEEADVIWSLDDTTAPFVPRLNTLYRWPVQRIYVNDYYNAKNTQEFMQRLYVWENGAFKHIWESNRVEVGASNAEGAANIDMRITNADHTYAHEFVFYYFKPADDGGGENDGAKQPGVWQNQVKITPRDNYLVEDGGGGSYHYDWPGDDDDDWVLAEEAPVVVKLNIVKMASVSGNPSPLGGATFTLYKSESVYSDFTGIDYTTGSGWSVAGTVQPEGYTGATFTSPITTGSYVLKETVVPANYVDAHNTWYIVYSGGELRVYLNDPTLNENARVALSENPTSGTLTYSATIGNVRDESTLARIRVVKYNENGSQTITGVDEWIDGNHHEYGERFTGAVYGLWKFAGSSFTGDKFVYGSTIICNGTDNFSDIEPGYYELAEIKAPDGYAIDPTPIRIVFNGTTITVTDTHGNSDQVGYLDGDQTLEATIGAQTTDGGKPAVTIGTKDKKTEYELTLRKLDGDAYDIDSEVPLVDVSFELYDTGTVPALKATAVTGIDGYATIKFPRENGDYTIKEVLPSGLSGLYTPAADYEIRIRDNELFVSGGPFGYDFKIVSGQRDGESYVILDPDGAATPVEPGDSGFPEGLTVPDHGIIGLIRASAEVPNYENQNPPDPTRLYVQKVYVTTDGDEVFIVQVSGDFSDTEATSKYIVFTKDGAGSTTGLPTLTGGAVYEGPYAWVASSAATGKAEVTGVKAGEVYTITEWVFDSAIDDEALLDASEYYTVTGEGPTAGLPATGDTTVVIDNVKIVVLTTSATINGIKAINGAPNSTKQFSFTLTQVDNADGDAFTGVTPYTATATVNGADSFSFTLADLGPGTYFYKVTEDGSGGSGWTYASAQYIVKVEVGAAPGLGVTYTYHEVVSDTASSTATFTNSYAATGSITLQAKKAIVGSAPALEDYDFAVYAGTDTTGSLVATGTSIGDGSITFTPAIEYTVADVGLHYYTIAETTPPDAGWTAPAAQTVTVNVIDNGDGTLTATYGSTPPTFTNTYNVTGTASAALTAKKTVTGAELTNGQFSFGLYNSNDTHTLVGSLIEEVTNDGGGNITFASLPYTAAGVHHYVIKELSASGNGWTVDASVYGVTVTVADDGEGGIEATVSYSTTTPPTFENVYAATGSVTLAAKKVISGTSAAFDGYDFAVYAGTDTTVAPVATGTSLADGSIVFAPAITYNAAGTYTYTIKETSTLGTGWTAPAAQTVTVNVVDNNDGTLTATPTYETPPTFTNTYNPPYVPPTPTPPTPTPTETPTPTPTPEETPTPTPTPSETPTPTPRVPVTPTPPVPPNDEGSYVEFDDDGSPLGEWHYDEDSGEWIFDEFPPLGAIDTGDGAIIPIALVALLVSAMGIFVLKPKKKK
jgi:pilin isopeptide linkage protein